jgi:putative serine protease PepD
MCPPITSLAVDADESPEEDGPLFAFVHPDDRLWRHPSEVTAGSTGSTHPSTAALRPLLAAERAPTAHTWAVAVVAGVVGALVASGVLAVAGDLSSRSTTVLAPVTRLVTPNTLASAAVASAPGWPAIVDAVAPSVASLTALTASGPEQGSAVVYGSDRDHDETYLITDAAVVQGAGGLDVTFNGGQAIPGHLVGTDPTSGLALLWVAGGDRAAPNLGSVDTLHEADAVMVLGGRSGGAAGTVAGSVSSLDRTVVDQDTSVATCGLLGVSATLPSGDDGGAVVDTQGSVVGISTGLESSDPGDAGMSFAVPIDVAIHVAGEMIAGDRVTHPWLGIDATSDLDSATSEAMGVPGGAEILAVEADSPAAAADLQPDDVVTSFDGHVVTSSGSLLSLVADVAPGQTATLVYRRGPATGSVRLRVAEQPEYLAG